MPPFLELVAAHRPVGLVVGLPLTGDGHEGKAAVLARELSVRLGARTDLPVTLVDERMTTARAHAAIAEQEGSTRGRRDEVDALAATILLQHFLETRRHARAQCGDPSP
jgi:putative Holliday junction resolvase